MSTDAGSSLPPAAAAAAQQAGKLWQGRAPRERQLILAMVVALAVLVVWLLGVRPALRTLGETPVELDRLDRQWQQMQSAALESESLRSASPVAPAQAAEALKSATERLGGKGKLVVQGERATLNFTAVPFEALRAWLLEARSGARARPVEAQMLKAQSGYSGTISVVFAGSP